MKSIIIGAGRGKRLKSMTDDQPKCYVEFGGKRILDWILEALGGAGLRDIVFVGGYRIDQIRGDYPSFTYCNNTDWPNNNILESLFYAESHMTDGFVCSYSDILFRSAVVKKALDHSADIVLCVDTDWRKRYEGRTEHPESDAEKVTLDEDRVTRAHRTIPPDQAPAEYIGVAKFSPKGAALFRDAYHRAKKEFAGKPWREAAVFEKAYQIMLYQEMLEQGADMRMVTTHGEYIEVDTQQDFEYASRVWKAS